MRVPVRSRDGEVTRSRIESALALAAYAGGLFAQDMIPGSLALTCLNALVSQPYVLEHLQAIHALLSHAGQKLCKAGSPDYWDSISSVVRWRATRLLNDASMANVSLDRGQVRSFVQDICDITEEWWKLSLSENAFARLADELGQQTATAQGLQDGHNSTKRQ